MVEKINHSQKESQKILKGYEKAFLFFFIVVFALLLGKHYEVNYAFVEQGVESVGRRAAVMANSYGIVDVCPSDEPMVVVSGNEYICANPDANVSWGGIYATYPVDPDGRESPYVFLNSGKREKADLLLNDTYDLDRYEPTTFENGITWDEDPYDERYWRFLFYSLRPMRHLLVAGVETGDDRYFEKYKDILYSFLDRGTHAEHAWDDYHGVAFRTMILTNSWWKLREHNELSPELSDKILDSLVEHGNFLLDPLHYEEDNNHGVTQALALLTVGENFPDLPGAETWRRVGIERIDAGLQGIIDPDGVLVENSPYYHYYVLEKYWEIYRYAHNHDIEISSTFDETVERMIDHATYTLLPNRNVPLLGASIPREIREAGEFREIAKEHPHFRYVLTEGKYGSVPEDLNIFYPSSGITIARSGWGERQPYEDETFLLFDAGPYRTDHSDLDALTFLLYADGERLIRDAGLYTYETENKYYDYFHGTYGHNTVVVDGKNQSRGQPENVELLEGDGYVITRAYHDLYDGVVHRRALVLIEESTLLIVDDLLSDVEHTYEQLFHLSPDAEVEREGYDVSFTTNEVPAVLYQLNESGIDLDVYEGDEERLRGFCAEAYEIKKPCPELSFSKSAADARFITLIKKGGAIDNVDISHSNETGILTMEGVRGIYDIRLGFEGDLESLLSRDGEQLQVEVDVRGKEEEGLLEKVQRLF